MFNQTHSQTKQLHNGGHSLLALCTVLFSLLPMSAMGVPDSWKWGHPFPHDNQINAVIWGNNEYVAVGDGGNVTHSADATINSWALQPSATTQKLNDIVWNGRRYIGVGDQGTIISGDTAATLKTRTSGTSNKLTNVIWNGEYLLAVGESSTVVNDPINGSITRPAATILTSKNQADNSDTGITWTLETAVLNPDRYDNIPPPRLRGVTWDGTHFIASSDNGAILTSTDGIAWYTRTIKSIAWNEDSINSLYLAIIDNGLVVTSTDKSNWTVRTPVASFSGNFNDVAWGDGRFLMVGDNGIAISSTDGVNWSAPESTGTSEMLRSITIVGSNFITVGDNGTIRFRGPGSSPWQIGNSEINEDLYSVAFGTFSIAVGSNGTIIKSANLKDWTKAANPPDGFSTDLLNVSFINNRFIASGKNGTLLSADSLGDNWSAPTNPASGISSEWLFDSTWDGTNYIVVGSNGTVVTSTDAVSWATQSSPTNEHLIAILNDGTSTLIGGEYGTHINTSDPTNIVSNDLQVNGTFNSGRITTANLNDILYANNEYFTVGNAGTILTSVDAIYWRTPATITGTGINNDLFKVIPSYVNNSLIASGAWGTLLRTTDDGVNWNSIGPPITGNADFLYGITTNTTTTMVTVGSGGSTFTSADNGNSWVGTAGPTQTTTTINGLTASDTLLVAVGDNGVILNSSNSGVSWNRQTAAPEYPATPPTTACTTSHLRDVAWKPTAPNRYIAVGDAGAVCISIDGSDWTSLPPTTPPDSSSNLYGIAWGGNQFVAVGGSLVNSVVYTSPNGDVWTPRNSNEPFTLRDIVWNTDRFIAVGDGGTITSSPKGIAWTRNSSGTTVNLKTIAVGTTMMVATGTSSSPLRTTVLRNEEGIWEGADDNAALANIEINDLSFGGTQFAGVGPSGTIVVSEDGTSWTAIATGTNSLFNAVTWDESKFTAAGVAGHILYADNHDLVMTGDFVTEKVREGEVARYQVNITNIGISPALAANYSEVLPRNSQFLSATTTRDNCTYGPDLTCSLGDMAMGDSATITVDVMVSALGTLLHTPTVVANNTDSDQANNSIIILLDPSRGNSESGGAAISYVTLISLLCLLLISFQRRHKR